jgi:hypothetical protein
MARLGGLKEDLDRADTCSKQPIGFNQRKGIESILLSALAKARKKNFILLFG